MFPTFIVVNAVDNSAVLPHLDDLYRQFSIDQNQGNQPLAYRDRRQRRIGRYCQIVNHFWLSKSYPYATGTDARAASVPPLPTLIKDRIHENQFTCPDRRRGSCIYHRRRECQGMSQRRSRWWRGRPCRRQAWRSGCGGGLCNRPPQSQQEGQGTSGTGQ